MKLPPSLVALLAGFAASAAGEEPAWLQPLVVIGAREHDSPPAVDLASSGATGRPAGTLAESLRALPGVILQESFGGFEPPRISLRGSGVQSAPTSRGVQLRLNDAPLGLADGSGNSALLDPALADQAAVLVGADAWRTAPGFAGGALDFRTRPDPSATAGARAEVDSWGGWRAGLAGSLSDGATSATVRLSAGGQQGWRDFNTQDRTAAFAALARAFASGRVGLDLYHAHLRYDVPGPLTLATALTAPRSVSADVRRDRPERVAEITRVAAGWEHDGPALTLVAGAAFARTADDFRQLQAAGVTASRSNDLHLRAAGARRLSAGARRGELRAAVEFDRGWRDQWRFVNAAGQAGAAFGHDGLFPTTAQAQVELSLDLTDRLAGHVGLAQLEARRDIADRFGAGPGSARRVSSGATLPMAGLAWRGPLGLQAFANVSAAAEPPTFDDLLVTTGTSPALVRRSQSLAAQRLVTWEAGVRGSGGPLTWSAILYHATWRHEILRLADANGVARGAVNAGPTTHDGVEAAARWAVLEGPTRVTLGATAGWTSFRFNHDPVYGNNRLAGIPPHFGSAELDVRGLGGAFATTGADWTGGSTRVDHAGRLAYGGQARVRLRAGWRHRDHWTVYAEVQNLLDRAGVASTAGVLDVARNPAATALFLPSTGRAVAIGMEWRR